MSTPSPKQAPPVRGLTRDGKKPDPVLTKAYSRALLQFGLALLGSFLAAQLPLPYLVAAPVFVGLSIWLGIRTIRAGRRAFGGGVSIPVMVGMAIAGLIGLSSMSTLALWTVSSDHQECIQNAITVTGTDACATQFEDSINSLKSSLFPSK